MNASARSDCVELDQAPWDWILSERRTDGALVLTVVVGWIGVFEHDHVLTADEVARYRVEGRGFLSARSREINQREIAAARERIREAAR